MAAFNYVANAPSSQKSSTPPKSSWGSSSATYGQVSPTGVVQVALPTNTNATTTSSGGGGDRRIERQEFINPASSSQSSSLSTGFSSQTSNANGGGGSTGESPPAPIVIAAPSVTDLRPTITVSQPSPTTIVAPVTPIVTAMPQAASPFVYSTAPKPTGPTESITQFAPSVPGMKTSNVLHAETKTPDFIAWTREKSLKAGYAAEREKNPFVKAEKIGESAYFGIASKTAETVTKPGDVVLGMAGGLWGLATNPVGVGYSIREELETNPVTFVSGQVAQGLIIGGAIEGFKGIKSEIQSRSISNEIRGKLATPENLPQSARGKVSSANVRELQSLEIVRAENVGASGSSTFTEEARILTGKPRSIPESELSPFEIGTKGKRTTYFSIEGEPAVKWSSQIDAKLKVDKILENAKLEGNVLTNKITGSSFTGDYTPSANVKARARVSAYGGELYGIAVEEKLPVSNAKPGRSVILDPEHMTNLDLNRVPKARVASTPTTYTQPAILGGGESASVTNFEPSKVADFGQKMGSRAASSPQFSVFEELSQAPTRQTYAAVFDSIKLRPSVGSGFSLAGSFAYTGFSRSQSKSPQIQSRQTTTLLGEEKKISQTKPVIQLETPSILREESKSGTSLIGGIRQDSKPLAIPSSYSGIIQNTRPDVAITPLIKVTPKQEVSQKLDTKTILQPETPLFPSERPGYTPKITTPIKPLWDWGNPPRLGGGPEKSFGTHGVVRFKGGYTPSLEAGLLNIRGKKPSKSEYTSGITLRPLIAVKKPSSNPHKKSSEYGVFPITDYVSSKKSKKKQGSRLSMPKPSMISSRGGLRW